MKPYIPPLLPLQSLEWESFIPLIGKANAEVARYDGILRGIMNPLLLLAPLTTKEAVSSSKIEGSIATLTDVLEYEASGKTSAQKYEDIQETINYRQAILYGVEYLGGHPIGLNLVRELHYMLLDSVRGKDKSRGEFRKTQNWIGKSGSPIEEAIYVPPPPEMLIDLFSNLEKYIHYEEKDRLVQLAVVHAQFEIIHPFLDGNGRVGRMLIPLFLVEKGLLGTPTLYISEYMEANRDMYIKRLSDISQNNNWTEWIVFFLNAVIEQAKDSTDKARTVWDLYNSMKQDIAQIIKSQYFVPALDTIFQRPILSTRDFMSISGIPKLSARRILDKFKHMNTLETVREGSGKRPELLVFGRLMDIVA